MEDTGSSRKLSDGDRALLTALIRKHIPREIDEGELAGQTGLVGLGLDSIRVVQLMFDVEDTFAVHFPDEFIDEGTFATLDALCEALATIRASDTAERDG